MSKRFVYEYMTKGWSSRMLGKAAREKVKFIWPARGQGPDLRTLNEFRGRVMEENFVTAVKMLKAKGYIRLEH
ncbi:MAG: hypothetical protein LBU25_10490 [Treponema sp.]|nr:hypothetical protein [Treponema sp.]